MSGVGLGIDQGPFKLSIRLCGELNPGRNGVELIFPTQFYELLIDEESFQHIVEDVTTLKAVAHIRFAVHGTYF